MTATRTHNGSGHPKHATMQINKVVTSLTYSYTAQRLRGKIDVKNAVKKINFIFFDNICVFYQII